MEVSAASARVVLVFALLAVGGCKSAAVCSGEGLAAAKTAADEKQAMQEFASTCGSLSFTPFDEAGTQLDMGEAAWRERLHHIELDGGRGSFEHRLIEAENIVLLMGE